MKYFILVADGCGDWPIPALDGKTPLETAEIKNINELAKISEVGLVRAIPKGAVPGSDTAILSLLGFDPGVYLTGRAPLEAAAMGIKMSEADAAFRVSLITLEGAGEYADLMIKDHSAGDISSDEAKVLIECLGKELGGNGIWFYPGVGYRNVLISDKLDINCTLTPPHDVLNQKAGKHLPRGAGAEELRRLMYRSYEILKNHPVNKERISNGLAPANSVWLWGQGRKPGLDSFEKKYGIKSSVITAVNLIKGIGVCAGLDCVYIPGANGTLHTNYEGKAQGAINEFKKGKDFVFIHVEAPDECSHSNDLNGKLEALAFIDDKVFKPVNEYLKSTGEQYRILVVTDHKTPLEVRTHTDEPTPYVLFDSEKVMPVENWKAFSEASGERGNYFDNGCDLADYFFTKRESEERI